MKKLIVALIVAIACFSAIVLMCYGTEKEMEKSYYNKYYWGNADETQLPVGLEVEYVDENRDMYILKESLTSHMYLGYKFSTYGVSHYVDTYIPLYDPKDGKPLSYKRYVELLSEKTSGSGLTYDKIEELLNNRQ